MIFLSQGRTGRMRGWRDSESEGFEARDSNGLVGWLMVCFFVNYYISILIPTIEIYYYNLYCNL